ncbi:MAG: DNA-protecting protein DprA, partial [Gammaproteobacteria bacterium]|nr:DNA-protecting protein DprA [Gammaproteobacteria bacterium]
GCDINYPATNSALAREIRETGLVLSEYPPGTPPLPGNFPKRNRIITGLAQGTLIVEARLKSGSLISAQAALDQNREVFAIPGPIQYGQYGGCHELIRSGAVLTETIADVLAEITLFGEVEALASPSAGASAESVLLALIDDQPVPYSSLLKATGFSMRDLSGQLSQLELAGRIVNSVEGYHRA